MKRKTSNLIFGMIFSFCFTVVMVYLVTGNTSIFFGFLSSSIVLFMYLRHLPKYKILNKDNKFYPQYRNWDTYFAWENVKDNIGDDISFETDGKAKEFINSR